MIEVNLVKKNKVRVLLGVGAVIAAAGGYLLWPEKKVAAPENTLILDKSKTENSEFYLSELITKIKLYYTEKLAIFSFGKYVGPRIYTGSI